MSVATVDSDHVRTLRVDAILYRAIQFRKHHLEYSDQGGIFCRTKSATAWFTGFRESFLEKRGMHLFENPHAGSPPLRSAFGHVERSLRIPDQLAGSLLALHVIFHGPAQLLEIHSLFTIT
jgi:hypothetical protein